MENTLSHPTLAQIIAENHRRNLLLQAPYDPDTGTGCDESVHRRVAVTVDGRTLRLPATMLHDMDRAAIERGGIEMARVRIKHDFEYWCFCCVKIHDKLDGTLKPLVLNRAQRKVLAELERQRLENKPIRLILLKARQWGGSTLIQAYMMWIQLTQRKHWNSLICGHKLATSQAIKHISDKILLHIPPEFLPEGERPQLKSYDGMRNVKQLTTTESLVVLGSAHCEDAVRGFDVKMVHMSEVGFWPISPHHSPQDVVRSVCGTVPLVPLSLVVLESTANGMGNFFHEEWLRAEAGVSDKTPVFVAWHEIEIYRLPVDDVEALWEQMDDYERMLWTDYGCTLESINWYHHKRREMSAANMHSEFPTNAVEAFSANGRNVLAPEHLEELRASCQPPQQRAMIGGHGVHDAALLPHPSGELLVWRRPERSTMRNRYVVAVDVGGRSERSDWSVITVMDRLGPDGKPEVAAQWRGHCDHDVLARKAAQVATIYSRALLVIESNTLDAASTEGNGGDYILREIASVYPNLYYRGSYERGESRRPGFQTNVSTKEMIVHNLIAWVRDHRYVEHDHEAVNEMSWYELKPNGRSYGAMRGKHDDLVMTRAIALWVIQQLTRRQARHPATPRQFLPQAPPGT